MRVDFVWSEEGKEEPLFGHKMEYSRVGERIRHRDAIYQVLDAVYETNRSGKIDDATVYLKQIYVLLVDHPPRNFLRAG